MFKRYRQLLIGIIIGALVFGGISAGAATVKKYTLTSTGYKKITINNKTYTSTNAPILKSGSLIYIPLTSTISKDLKVKLSTNTKLQTLSITPEKLQPITKEIVYTEDDKNIGHATVEDVAYVSLSDVSKHYNLPIDNENGVVSIYKDKNSQYNDQPLKTNIPNSKLKNDIYITEDYYTDTLYPIIKINSPIAIAEEKEKEQIKKTPDGIEVNYINDQPYVLAGWINNKYSYQEYIKANKCSFSCNSQPSESDPMTLKYSIYNDKNEKIQTTILISDMPYTQFNDEDGNARFYITYDYYVNTILPLIRPS